MTVHRINPDSLTRPSGFSHAVTATGGTLIFLAGQTALDAEGRITGGNLPEQFERALLNLLAALEAAGGHPSQLARVTVYATDPGDYRDHSAEIGRIWRKHAGAEYPAMALVGVTRLWDDDALVELDGIAVRPVTGRHHRQ